ncbi:MAG: type I-E CRISPR-associated protein Cas6/Cse3/CasE [Proteobacteria bacterium]|nr:type I-E CRISPR-associated protein Cas6/Cse3/CasE [Pseudomonadota bacterium]
MTRPLHLVRLWVDGARLHAFARQSRLPLRDFDDGYAVHALFAALFDHDALGQGRLAPRPFRILDSSRRRCEVLAYATADHRALVHRARTFGDPGSLEVCDLERLVSRPVPHFRSGIRLGFSARVCPVRRLSKERIEIDAFLARVRRASEGNEPPKREAVYREWLAEQLEADNAARLLTCGMSSFRLGRQYRRTQGERRKAARLSRPEAVFEGELEVRDSAAFGGRLERGLGRHRAFGFGMLLLRPSIASSPG